MAKTVEEYFNELSKENPMFCPPHELPAGFFETVQPLATYIKRAQLAAYRAGWYDGMAAHQRGEKFLAS